MLPKQPWDDEYLECGGLPPPCPYASLLASSFTSSFFLFIKSFRSFSLKRSHPDIQLTNIVTCCRLSFSGASSRTTKRWQATALQGISSTPNYSSTENRPDETHTIKRTKMLIASRAPFFMMSLKK